MSSESTRVAGQGTELHGPSIATRPTDRGTISHAASPPATLRGVGAHLVSARRVNPLPHMAMVIDTRAKWRGRARGFVLQCPQADLLPYPPAADGGRPEGRRQEGSRGTAPGRCRPSQNERGCRDHRNPICSRCNASICSKLLDSTCTVMKRTGRSGSNPPRHRAMGVSSAAEPDAGSCLPRPAYASRQCLGTVRRAGMRSGPRGEDEAAKSTAPGAAAQRGVNPAIPPARRRCLKPQRRG